MWAQVFDDFFRILQLLRRKERVIQQPVIGFSVLVPGAEQFDCRIQQLEHFMAAFDAFGMMFDVASSEISTSQVDGLQKVLNGGAVLNFKF